MKESIKAKHIVIEIENTDLNFRVYDSLYHTNEDIDDNFPTVIATLQKKISSYKITSVFYTEDFKKYVVSTQDEKVWGAIVVYMYNIKGESFAHLKESLLSVEKILSKHFQDNPYLPISDVENT